MERKRKTDDASRPERKRPGEPEPPGRAKRSKFSKGGVQKPPDWVEFKKRKKLARENRRRAGLDDDFLATVARAKALSEKVRRKKMAPDEKATVTEQLHALLNNKNYYEQLILAHDTSRIVQWLLKYASDKIREEAARALHGSIVRMLQSKYARNSVKRILKYGSKAVRNSVLDAINGHIVNLASHTLSAPILDYAYTEIASGKQKSLIRQEFYGDIYKTSKDDSVQKLSDTYKQSPDMKVAILAATKANIQRVLNKNVHDSGLLHAVLYDYLKECTCADRSEMITTLCPLVAPLSNSKPGVNAAMMCIWHGTNKDKKTIIKVLKEHAVSLSTHEYGHLLILSVLSAVDDTVLLNKALLSVLLKDVKTLVKEDWGRKVILWLVAPGDTTYFHPSVIELLNTGFKEGTAKKPLEQKHPELLKEVLPAICDVIQQDPGFWFSSGALSLTIVAILKAVSSSNLQVVLDAVSEFICQESWSMIDKNEKIDGIEHPGIHLSLKKIAQHDKVRTEREEYTFGESVCKFLSSKIISIWITKNRGCFLLIELFKNNQLEVQNSLKKMLTTNLNILKAQSTAGAKILLEKIR